MKVGSENLLQPQHSSHEEECGYKKKFASLHYEKLETRHKPEKKANDIANFFQSLQASRKIKNRSMIDK